MRRAIAATLLALLSTTGCATAGLTPMQRALDPSMERVLRLESYLRTVSGISSNPERLSRSDGYIYLADVAPQLRYMAAMGDGVRYRALRGFIVERLMRPESGGLVMLRRYRRDAPTDAATRYGYLWLMTALREGWTLLGDTASAQTLARLKGEPPVLPANATAQARLTVECGEALDKAETDLAPARRVLAAAGPVVGAKTVESPVAVSRASAVEGEVDLLSCLTRVGVVLNDPDAAVRHLEHLLSHLSPLVDHSGRPDLGTASDVLLTLQRVRQAGPQYYDPAVYVKRSARAAR